jgi:hypothetical protein
MSVEYELKYITYIFTDLQKPKVAFPLNDDASGSASHAVLQSGCSFSRIM